MSAEELQRMMEQIESHRKKERDYTSLEDQIRCLKRRYAVLCGDEVIPLINKNVGWKRAGVYRHSE